MNKSSSNKSSLAAALAGAVLLAASTALPSAAQADTFNLTSCHLTGGCGTATQFGTVTLTQAGTSVNFDVVLNSAGSKFVETGAGGDELFLFNDSISGSTITSITATLNGANVSHPGGPLGIHQHIAGGHGRRHRDFHRPVECTDRCSAAMEDPLRTSMISILPLPMRRLLS